MRNINFKRGVQISLFLFVLLYVGSVINYEVNLGRSQPMRGNSIIIATYDDENERHERVLSLREMDNEKYISANHWPRVWYRQALGNPNVEIKLAGEERFANFTAVPLEDAEDERIRERFKPSFRSQLRMGFAPREYLRLDPR